MIFACACDSGYSGQYKQLAKKQSSNRRLDKNTEIIGFRKWILCLKQAYLFYVKKQDKFTILMKNIVKKGGIKEMVNKTRSRMLKNLRPFHLRLLNEPHDE